MCFYDHYRIPKPISTYVKIFENLKTDYTEVIIRITQKIKMKILSFI